jgi:hypothetical protein
MTYSGPDRAAEVAQYIMHANRRGDSRFMVFDLWRIFSSYPPEHLMRGIHIALEIYEATEVKNDFPK